MRQLDCHSFSSPKRTTQQDPQWESGHNKMSGAGQTVSVVAGPIQMVGKPHSEV